MKTLRNTDLAYAAGFIDGEGCIDFYTRHYTCVMDTSVTIKSHSRIRVNNTNEEVLLWLQTKFGGSVFIAKTNPKHKHQWTWQLVEERKVNNLLRLLLPYLIVKREKAERILNDQDPIMASHC
jgi:hypothetical protein